MYNSVIRAVFYICLILLGCVGRGGDHPPRQILSANFAGKFWKNWSVSDIIRLNILECNKMNSKHILYTLLLSAHPSYIVTSMYFRHGFYFFVGIFPKFVGNFGILSAQPPPGKWPRHVPAERGWGVVNLSAPPGGCPERRA